MKADSSARFTQGPIGITMLKSACAMLAGTLAISGYNIVDTYFVGQLGKIPLAAMGYTFPVIMIVGCIFFGVAAGIMTTTAQALGSDQKQRAARIVTSGLQMLVMVSICAGAFGILVSPWIFRLMGTSAEAYPLTMEYMTIWYLGCVTGSLSMAGNKLLIGAGDSNMAAAMMVVGLVINAVLDPIFIFGWCGAPAMGIAGAALATVISQLISTILLLTLLRKKYHLVEFCFYRMREFVPLCRLIFRYAVPASIGMLMMPLSAFVVTWITARFGDAAVAAVAAASRLEGIAFIFPMALGIPMLSMVGQNYGAKLYTRIRQCFRFSMNFAFFFLLGMAVLYFLFARYLVAFFSPDPDVQEIMKICLLIIPWGFGFVEIHRYSGFFYTGCDRPSISAWLSALRVVGLLLPLSFLSLYFRKVEYLFFARLIADIISGSVAWYLARRMVKRLPEMDGEDDPK